MMEPRTHTYHILLLHMYAQDHLPSLHASDSSNRQTLRLSPAKTSQSDDASLISYSCGTLCTKTSRPVQSLLYLKRTIWHTSGATASAQTSPNDELGHCIASSNAVPYTLSFAAPLYYSCFSRPATGMPRCACGRDEAAQTLKIRSQAQSAAAPPHQQAVSSTP